MWGPDGAPTPSRAHRLTHRRPAATLMGVRLASTVGADTHRSPLKGFAVPRVARVLVVDDDPLVLEIVKELLVAQGYEVAATHSGAQAFAMMEASPPDVLLLDINLP